MNTAEIVMNSIESYGMTKVINLFGESISQSGKSSHRHSHGQILTLNIAGRNVVGIRLSTDNSGSSTNAFCWTITSLRFRWDSVEFNQSRVVNIRTKSTFNRFQICSVAVSGKLDAIGKSFRKILHEFVSTSCISSSNETGNNQLGVSVYRNPSPNVSVPEFAPEFLWYVLLFCIAELPDFITLNPARPNPANSVIVKLCTRCSDTFQEAKDCAFGYSGHAAGSADGIPFHEGINYSNLLGAR